MVSLEEFSLAGSEIFSKNRIAEELSLIAIPADLVLKAFLNCALCFTHYHARGKFQCIQ